MVQGLGFLAKKSWHTKNMANQEKVWVAEERKRAEEQKTKELARQIQQEREQEELDNIAGHKKKLDRGIDWMYQGQSKDSEIAKEDEAKKNEEFLLGKEFVPDNAAKGDLDQGGINEGVNKVLASTTTTAAATAKEEPEREAARPRVPVESVADRNEAFRIRHEDPMFLVTQRETEKKRAYEKKKELYERVTGKRAVDASRDYDEGSWDRDEEKRKKKRRKEDKKDRKRRKKKHKKRRHDRHHSRKDRYSDDDESVSSRSYASSHSRGRRDDSDDEYSRRQRGHSKDEDRRRRSDNNRRRRSPSRSRSVDRPGRRSSRDIYQGESDEFGRKRQSHPDSDRQRRRDYDRERYDRNVHEHDSERRYRRHDDNDRHSQYRDDRRDRYDSDRRRHNERKDRHSDRSRTRHERQHDRYNDDGKPPSGLEESHARDHSGEFVEKKSGYGLQGSSASKPRISSPADLGPDQELLRRKRQEKEEERRRLLEHASSRRYRTPEEREAALRAMELDAQKRSGQQARTVAEAARRRLEEEEEMPQSDQASFVRDMSRKTHGVGEGSISMSERLKQNRNTAQRSHEKFL